MPDPAELWSEVEGRRRVPREACLFRVQRGRSIRACPSAEDGGGGETDGAGGRAAGSKGLEKGEGPKRTAKGARPRPERRTPEGPRQVFPLWASLLLSF